MSDPGTPPPTPPLPPTPPAKRSRKPLVIGLLVLLVLELCAGGFVAYKVLDDDPDSKEAKIVFPDAWDERVLPYVKIAEKERDLDFKHPVEVRFLDPKTFVEERRVNEDEITDEDRKEIEDYTGLYRAVGLISGDVDLLKSFQDLDEASVLAYYSFGDKRITIRGTTITPAIKSTLVHELVHVLQDQHFDIGKRNEELGEESEDDKDTTTESSVLDAVIEGDASRIETQYKESLSTRQRRALEKSEEEQSEEPSKAVEEIPEIISTIQGAPYVLGEAVVQAVADDGGNDAVDDLFTDTPEHDSSLLDAFEILTEDTDAEDVEVPALADGEEKFDTGEFGALSLYFVLAERLPLKKALATADEWGGDQYVSYKRDGASCFRIAYAADDDDAADALHGALREWAAATPATSKVERDGDQVVLQSCDPGKDGYQGKDASRDALNLAASRVYLGRNILRSGAKTRQAGCLADGLIQEFTLAQLNDDDLAKDPTVQARVRQLGLACR